MLHFLQWKELIFFLIFNLYLPLCNSLNTHGPEANISVVAFHSLIPIKLQEILFPHIVAKLR